MPCQNGLAVGVERGEDAVGGDHGAHRRVGGGEALRGRDDVGLVAVAPGAEPVAEPAPGADDLVGDQQDAVLVADLADLLEVALGREEAAARVLDGLEDHAGDGLRALPLDPLADRLGRVVGLRAVRVRVGDVGGAGEQRLERAAGAREPGRGQRAHGRAVVGELAGDDLVAAALAVELVVLAAELEGRVDRLAAAAREEDAVEVAGGEPRDAGGELDRPRVRVAPVRVEAELLALVGAGLGDLGAAVADVHAVQRGQAVEEAAPVLVEDVAALALDDDGHLVGRVVAAHRGEVHPQVLARQVLHVAGREVLDGRHPSPFVHFVDSYTPIRTRYRGGRAGANSPSVRPRTLRSGIRVRSGDCP